MRTYEPPTLTAVGSFSVTGIAPKGKKDILTGRGDPI
jgi:hypothetical protein